MADTTPNMVDSTAGEDPTLPVTFGESINFSQLPNVTLGPDITAANFSDHFPDSSVPAIQKVGSGRMSPVRAHTMKEYEQQISELKKENFSLKLRIYFMEERMQQKFEDNDDITTNIELKVEVESLKKELMEKQQLLVKASNAVESLAHEKDIIAEKLKEEKEDALNQLKEQLDGKCRRIQQELEEAQKRNNDLQQQLNDAASAHQNLEGALHNKSMEKYKHLENTKEALAEKDRVIEQLNAALGTKDQIIGRLNDEKVTTARKTIQPLQEEVNRLRKDLQEQDNQMQEMLQGAGRDKDQDRERVRKQYEDVYIEQEKRVHDLEEATEKLQDEVRDKSKAIKDMENALKVSQKVIKELDGKLKDKEQDIKAQESNARKRDKVIQGLTETVKAKDKEIHQLCDQVEDLEEALTGANEKIHHAEKRKYEGIEQHQSSLSELEGKVADLRATVHTKDLENERLQRSMARKQQELDRLRDEKDHADDQTDGLLRQKDDTMKLLKDQLQEAKAQAKENADAIEQHYQNQLEDSQQQLEIKERAVQRLTKGLQEKDRLIKAQQASTDGLIEDLRDKVAERDKAVQDANEEKLKAIEAKEGELRQMRQALRDRQRDLDKANADVMDDGNKIGELDAKLKDLENKNKQLSDNIKALMKTNQDAEDNHHRSLGEKEAIISRLQAAIAAKERELDEGREAVDQLRKRNGAIQDETVKQLGERLKEKDKQLELMVSERAQVAADNERATQDLLQTIRDKDGQIKDLNDKYNRALVDKGNAVRDLQRQLNEKDFEVQNVEETLARADHEQGMLLGKMRNALVEKDKTIEKLLESGREKDRLFLEMQQSAIRASPSPSQKADMARLREDNDRLGRELDKKAALIERLKSSQPDEDYVESLKEDLESKNKLLAKAKDSLESLQEEQKADRQAKQEMHKLSRRNRDLEDDLQAKQDHIDALQNSVKMKDKLIKELKMENSRVNSRDKSPTRPRSDSSEQLEQLLQEQIRELSRLTDALHSTLPLNVNISQQSDGRDRNHDNGSSIKDILGAELAAMQTLRRQLEEGFRRDNHLHVVLDRQGVAPSSTTSGVGSGVGSDDASPTVTTASEAQRRSFGVGHDPEVMQPQSSLTPESGMYIRVPHRTPSVDDLSDPTAATTFQDKSTQELHREVAGLRSKLLEARRRQHSLEKQLEREELESLRSIPGQEQDEDPQVVAGLQKDLAALRKKLRDSERQNTAIKQQLDAALLNQARDIGSGDHVLPILKQQLDQAKSLLEEKDHKLQAVEQQNLALRHHLGIGPESPPESGQNVVDNLKHENERLASQLHDAVEREHQRLRNVQNELAEASQSGSASSHAQVAQLQKKLEKAKNLIELLKRHIRLNNSGVEGQDGEFNPELIVDMAREIERLRAELDSANEKMKQESNEDVDGRSRTRPMKATMPTALQKQFEKAQGELQATKRRFRTLTLKLHATEGTVHQQAERIKRYRRQLHNAGLAPPGTPKRVSSDSNLMHASMFAQSNRRLSAASLSQVPSSDEGHESSSSASPTPSERSFGVVDVTFSGFGLTNDTEELKEQIAVLKKQLKRCRHVIRKLQTRLQSAGISRASSPSRLQSPSDSNAWFELVANKAAFERLQQDLENVTAHLEKVMDANASLQERNTELLAELVELQSQKQSSFSEEVIRSQEAEIGRLHEQLAELRSLMSVLTTMLSEALSILRGMEKDNKRAWEGMSWERVTAAEERLRDGSEVVDTITRLLGDESQFGRRPDEEGIRELFSNRLKAKDEEVQQLRDEIRGQQKLNRELQEILHENEVKAEEMSHELSRLKSQHREVRKLQEELDSQKKLNQEVQDILHNNQRLAEESRRDLEREYEKEIHVLQERLEEAKRNSRHREKKKSPDTSNGQGNMYLYETNIKLTTENKVLQQRLLDKEGDAAQSKADLDRANKEIKRLQSEKRRLSEEKQRVQEQLKENEQLANSLRFELSVYEQLHDRESPRKSPGSSRRSGGHSSSSSSHRITITDRTTGLDLSELLQELRHLRIQLERSIETNNALRLKLEEALREKSFSPSSPSSSTGVGPKTTTVSEETRIHQTTRHKYTDEQTRSRSSRQLFTDSKNERHSRSGDSSHLVNGMAFDELTMEGITHLQQSLGTRNSAPSTHVDDGNESKRETYAISMVSTYEAMKAGIKEAAVVSNAIEAQLREKLAKLAQALEESSPHSPDVLLDVSRNVKRLLTLLDASTRHLGNFWTADRLVHSHCSDEVKELRKRLGAQEKLMREARDRLAATNREKESMEDAIIRQLCKTHDVIRRAKGNLQAAES